MLTVAIVGRPNVGKSTLFNRFAGKHIAITHDTPGVTRDRKEADAQLGPLAFRIVDTAGFEEGETGSLSQRMTGGTIEAIREADVCLFVIDVRAGVTTGDEIIAGALRRAGKPVVLVANKCEGRLKPNLAEAYSLGFGEPVAVSAEHALGMIDLVEALAPFAEKLEAEEEADAENKPLKLAIVGRPNVGKSSLFNRLLGEERSLTGPEAGITRDSVIAKWIVDGREILLHDTAGMRRKSARRPAKCWRNCRSEAPCRRSSSPNAWS